ncbi:MAG: hypothetical protein HY811_02175 [Planctomycetes bacterium]|nr:hypothetical protein [Planctomycetota bacterium]
MGYRRKIYDYTANGCLPVRSGGCALGTKDTCLVRSGGCLLRRNIGEIKV